LKTTDMLQITRTTHDLAAEISRARLRAHEKHGENSIEAIDGSDPRWLSILVEEVGEAAHELTYDATGSLRDELLDIITVTTAWVAAIDRQKSGHRA
jgi:NTP pyrophosphatase (non-canonical NTP hydrolase)